MKNLNGWIRLYIVLLVPLVLVISVWTYVGQSQDYRNMLHIVNNQSNYQEIMIKILRFHKWLDGYNLKRNIDYKVN